MNDASNPRSHGSGRPAVDLDELERQLRQMAAARPAPGTDAMSDLARIIDRSDPVRAALRGTLADERPAPPQQQFSPAAPEPASPAYEQPVYQEPAYQEPAYQAPVEPEPVYQEPVYQPAPARPSLDAEREALVRAAQEDAVAALERAFAKELLDPPAAAPAPPPQVQPMAPPPVAAAMVPAREALEAFLRREPAQQPQPLARSAPADAWPIIEPTARQALPSQSIPQPAVPMPAVPESRFALPEPEPELDTYSSEPMEGYDTQSAAAPAVDPEQDMRPLSRRRGGKGAMIAASMLGVAVLGLVLAFAFRSNEPSAPSGQPPLVRADDSPNKVAPTNPGGLDIPNQNKQIYEPSQAAAPGSSNVVTTTEQPVDLNQVVRSQPSRVVLPGPGGAGADAPSADQQSQSVNPVNQLLGEPRRVKTVAVRPDGTIIGTDSPASLAPAPAPAPVAPAIRPTAPATTGAATPAPAEPARTPGTTGGNLSALATAASVPLSISPGAADSEKNQQRIVAPAPRTLPPVAQAAPAAPPTRIAAAPATAPTAAPSGGGFTVQLAAPGSEQEARSTYASLQRRFPGDLGSYSPIVRRAEVGNRTLYRLRVGPMDRAGAVALCERLKAGGGQCFVAANN